MNKAFCLCWEHMRQQLVRKAKGWMGRFILSAVGIILITGVAKMAVIFGGTRVLDTVDPVFAFKWRYLILSAGVLEIAVAAICAAVETNWSVGILAWFTTNLACYRVTLSFVAWQHPCPCLGNLTDVFGVAPGTANVVTVVLLVYLLVVSYGSILVVLVESMVPKARRAISSLNRRLVASLIIVAAGLCSGSSAFAAPYIEVQVAVSQTNFGSVIASGTNATPRAALSQQQTDWSFRCVTGEDRWLIESHFAPNAIDAYYFDGTNVYHTTRITHQSAEADEILKRTRLMLPPMLKQPEENAWITLTITPGGHPLSDLGGNLPWLAFCSGKYLQTTNQLPLTGADVRHFPGSFGFTHRAKVFEDGLRLPVEVDFLASVSLFEKAPLHESLLRNNSDLDELRMRGRAQVAVPDGFLAGKHRVLNHASVDGFHIPLQFCYEQYEPAQANKTGKLRLALTARVTHYQTLESLSTIVSPTQRFGVIDYRFRDHRRLVDEIRYSVTNGVIPSLTDPTLEQLFRTKVARAPLDPIFKARYGIYGLFSVFLAGPVIVTGLWWLKKRRQHKQRNT